MPEASTPPKHHLTIAGNRVKPLVIIGQVAIVKTSDGFDVWHVLSDRYIVGFSRMCRRSDVERFCDLLRRVDIDAYWTGGCVDATIPAQAGECMKEWQRTMGISRT